MKYEVATPMEVPSDIYEYLARHGKRFWRRFRATLAAHGITEEDVMQQSMLEYCAAHRRGAGERAHIVYRRMLDWLRRESGCRATSRRRVQCVALEDMPEWEQPGHVPPVDEAVTLRRFVQYCVARDVESATIIHRYLEGHTMKAIGREIGVGESRVSQRIRHMIHGFVALLAIVVLVYTDTVAAGMSCDGRTVLSWEQAQLDGVSGWRVYASGDGREGEESQPSNTASCVYRHGVPAPTGLTIFLQLGG